MLNSPLQTPVSGKCAKGQQAPRITTSEIVNPQTPMPINGEHSCLEHYVVVLLLRKIFLELGSCSWGITLKFDAFSSVCFMPVNIYLQVLQEIASLQVVLVALVALLVIKLQPHLVSCLLQAELISLYILKVLILYSLPVDLFLVVFATCQCFWRRSSSV